MNQEALLYFALHVAVTLAAGAWVVRRVRRYTRKEMDRLTNALSAIAFAVVLGLSVGLFAASSLQYGWGVFVALPVVCGFTASLMHGWRYPLSTHESVMVALYSLGVLGMGMLVIAFEGLICLSMAAPIAIPGAILGGALAAAVLRTWRDPRRVGTTGMLAIVLPFGTVQWERVFPAEPPVYPVTSVVEIAAPPEKVWSAIIHPYQLERSDDLVFHVGVAYPLGAWIDGTGTDATRYCAFSTGRYVEPVVEWNENELLRFKVVTNPSPMQEWNPFAEIHPPHLDGFLVVKQGQFRLTRIPGGTRLEGTTWYQHGLQPAGYWRWWSDGIIHRIHGIVLGHLKELAEQG